jgi:ribosomal protein S18 acetylase RimI-like enzyme
MWPSILKIQDEAYELIAPESLDVLRSKWSASPNTCLVGIDDKALVEGYLLSHPWRANSPPPLYEKVLPLPGSTTLYLHDLAVSRKARSTGLARLLFETFRDKSMSAGYQTLELISIQNSIGFWIKMGFSVDTRVSLPESYGNGAAFMRASL